MNIYKYEYRYHTDILYNNELKEVKPILMIFPRHCTYVLKLEELRRKVQ
jgi:hypothetical protein